MAGLITLTILFNLLLRCHGVEKVFVMRHCARSMYRSLRHRADPAFDSPDNYTKLPFPALAEWHAEADAHCTARGKDLATIFGASMAEVLPSPIHVVADNVSRCIDTAAFMTKGFGSKVTIQEGVTRYIEPVTQKVCPHLSAEVLSQGVKEQLAKVADPSHKSHPFWVQRHELLAQLQNLVGSGVAPGIETIQDKLSEDIGIYTGGLYASSQAMIENFILEAASGLSTAWGKLDGSKRTELWEKWDGVNILYNYINHGSQAVSTRNGPIVWSILQHLKDDPSSGSRLMASHDTTIDGIRELLGLTWNCGPFLPNAAQPYMGLLFTREADAKVTVQIVCTAFEGDDAGKAIFGSVDAGTHRVSEEAVSIDSLLDDLKSKLDFDCVEPELGSTVV